MLRKLMKYDLRSIFRYWWIIALSSVGLSFVGGFSMKYLTENAISSTAPDGSSIFFTILALLGVASSIMGISAFVVASEIFVLVRFYKNFYSDEGYLTFTLPVKRRDHLNSKLISAFLTTLATLGVIIIDALIFILLSSESNFFENEIWQIFSVVLKGAAEYLGAYLFVYIFEAIAILFFLLVSSYLFIFSCISFAATVAKKHKVLAAIGIYYLFNIALSLFMQLLMIFGMISIAGIIETLPAQSINAFIALMLFGITLILAAVATILYAVEHYLLDKKLNLS